MPAVIPALAAVGGGSALAGGVALGSTALGAYSTIKGMNDAKKAANKANQVASNAGVNIPEVANLAEQQALRNIQNSRAVEQQYAPELGALRTGSVNSLLALLDGDTTGQQLQAMLSQRLNSGAGSNTYGGGVASSVNPITGLTQAPAPAAPITADNASSALLQQAIAKASSDLGLGGNLSQDVRNAVMRSGAARAGGVTGNLGLARDISARDLGLTSLDLERQRLNTASSLGQAELAGNQFNSGLQYDVSRTNANNLRQALEYATSLENSNRQFDASMFQQANQFDAGQRQQANQFDTQFGANNMLNIAQLLQGISGDRFGRALGAAQFGQSIPTPVVGLDPSSIANLAVGNSNVQTQAGLQAAQNQGLYGNQLGQFGGGMLGLGLGMIGTKNPTLFTGLKA